MNDNKFEAWYELAETANKDSLNAFVKTVKMGVTDVESLVHAAIASMTATLHAVTEEYNLNEDFMYVLSVLVFRHMNGLGDGFTNIIDYNNMLDPSKRHLFERTVSAEVFEDLQEKAEEMLQDDDLAPEVRYHLENIRKGKVPFGYELAEDIMYTNPRTYEILAQQETIPEQEYVEEESEEKDIDDEEVYNPFMYFDNSESDGIQIIDEHDDNEEDEEDEEYYADPVFQEPEDDEDYTIEINSDNEEDEEEHQHMSLEQAMALLRRTQMELDEQNSLIGDDF